MYTGSFPLVFTHGRSLLKCDKGRSIASRKIKADLEVQLHALLLAPYRTDGTIAVTV
jgi:hypothetical protein